MGERHWTKKKFTDKTLMVGKTVLWAGCPEVIGLAEVENDFVLRRIAGSDVLRKSRYRYVHFESPDPRGIDVALLYVADSLKKVVTYPVRIDSVRTRDILYVCLEHRRTGERWHFFVNHHPSKYGGKQSEGKREMTMRKLKASVDSLTAKGEERIIAMGDFNDVPSAPAFSIICNPPEKETIHSPDTTGPSKEIHRSRGREIHRSRGKEIHRNREKGNGQPEIETDSLDKMGGQRNGGYKLQTTGSHLVNLGRALEKTNRGSIRYRGNWQLIDNFLVSESLSGGAVMEILAPVFLVERDRQWPGEKPKRTYVGPRYNGGVSDHLPVRLTISQ